MKNAGSYTLNNGKRPSNLADIADKKVVTVYRQHWYQQTIFNLQQ